VTAFDRSIDAADRLRDLYRQPSQVVIDKAIDRVDEGVRGFVARSPLFGSRPATAGRATRRRAVAHPASCGCSTSTASRSAT
jgi:hypothetical protein